MRSLARLSVVVCFLAVPQMGLQADEVAKPDPAFVKKLQQAGAQVMELAQSDHRLTVAFHLSDKEIGDDTLKLLAGATNIVELNLRGTNITDAGLAHLAGLTNLQKLHLEKTKIDGSGLVHLKGLAELQYLNLYGTAVTDAGIEPLKGMPSLQKVYLWETQVTDDGQKALQNSLPKAYVNRGIDPPKDPLAAPKPAAPEPPKEEKPAEEKKPD